MEKISNNSAEDVKGGSMPTYWGPILRVAHLAVISAMVGLTALGPTWLLPLLTLSWVGMLACFWLNQGCIVTRLENYLTGDDTTIIDPFLAPFGAVNAKNRNAVTVSVGLIMLATALLRMLKK